jgi:hypothetical protein
MKHLKLFENFQDIDSICKQYGIENYTVNPDGTLDVDGYVYLSYGGLIKLPLKFGKVTGSFYCFDNQLTALEGSPREVGGDFNCFNNKLTALEGGPREVVGAFNCSNNQLTALEDGPREVGGDFDCSYNQLTALEGGPREVGGDFLCYRNQLTTLEGGPREVNGGFYCDSNQLTTLEGGPREVGGYFNCAGNPIYSIYKLFPDYKSYLDSLDYGYLRGTDISKSRFKEALDELNIKMPESISGYKYI